MYDTIVIGAGQAGLAAGYYLKQLRQKFLILDKAAEIGESWKERYDSLVLFTPRRYNSLPGLPFNGENHGFPTKDEVAVYLKSYVGIFKLPIQLKSEVVHVSKVNGVFLIITNHNEYQAKNLIIAAGPFQTPKIPSISRNISSAIFQLHSSQYKNLKQLTAGNVLVVGGGNSGAQIAVELSKERTTYLAHSKKLRYFPLIFQKKSIFWWFEKIGILHAKNHSLLGRLIQRKGDPIFGLQLKDAIKQNEVVLKKRVVNGKQNVVIFEDGSMLEVNNIIWATGFEFILPWLKIEGVLNEKGEIVHRRGVSNVTGLYFVGLQWQYRRGSALLQGVGYDAKFIAECIKNLTS
ncbi:NAD(P)/FAD-dependent oxidoreductase [Cytobacillus horneckiae]|uniref:flavin-containing monooxygenase n=1 Tax=Cytobacillus horneckiae TaxID=549687 RepID=UPI0039A30B66